MKQKATKDSVLAAVRGILAGGVVSFSTDDVVSITKGSKATVLRLIHENAEAIEQMKTEGISLPVSIRDDVLRLGHQVWFAATSATQAQWRIRPGEFMRCATRLTGKHVKSRTRTSCLRNGMPG